MNRRQFLLAETSGLLARAATGPAVPVRIEIAIDKTRATIPPDCIGLGYEISSVAAGILSAKNQEYVSLVKALGPQGVIRIGGNTSDYARFEANGQPVSAPNGTVVNESNLHDLASFLDATGWRLIWGLNLGRGTAEEAATEAAAVSRIVKDKLLAFEIGNEPDLFGHAHRNKNYSYDDYLREYRTFKAAVRQAVPHTSFAGPDAATQTNWVARFASDEGNDLKLLTHHYYRECASPVASLDRLLHTDPKLEPQLQQLRAASASAHLPYRICEVNSLCGGGKPGVSDTLGSALWVLDYLFTVAEAGGAGVNIETGVNQLGFVSWYSPIVEDGHGSWTVRPDYYGMLAFAQASRGDLLTLDCHANGMNLRAYAVTDHSRVWTTIINKDSTQDAAVTVAPLHSGRVMRLIGPSIDSKTGVSLHTAEVAAAKNGAVFLRVPAASAAIITSSAQ